jgi:hypothetical protein
LAVGDDGGVVAALEGLEVVFDGVLAGADEGEEAGAAGAVDVGWPDVLGVASFFSPATGMGASLSDEGFILSE